MSQQHLSILPINQRHGLFLFSLSLDGSLCVHHDDCVPSGLPATPVRAPFQVPYALEPCQHGRGQGHSVAKGAPIIFTYISTSSRTRSRARSDSCPCRRPTLVLTLTLDPHPLAVPVRRIRRWLGTQ